MTEKIEIREYTQENRIVLCVCIAELQSQTQLFITLFQASISSHTHKNNHRNACEYACIITHIQCTHLQQVHLHTHTHTHSTTHDHKLGQRSFSHLLRWESIALKTAERKLLIFPPLIQVFLWMSATVNNRTESCFSLTQHHQSG